MTNDRVINEKTGCMGDGAGPKEPHRHLGGDNPEGRSKSVQNSNNITMTLARATKDITAPKTGEREQSTAKKLHSARKKDLLSFLGKEHESLINAVKM